MNPLLLIPGMMCDARLFSPQVRRFSGELMIVHAAISAQKRVEDLAAAILLDAPARFALAGLSMGGIVAMEVLRQAPERVDRIALLDTNPLAEVDAVKQKRVPQMAAVRAGGLGDVMRQEMMPNYLAEQTAYSPILDLCLEMALDLGDQVFLNQSVALMDRPDQTETLRNADIPALVLCGREDRLCPVHRHELMADLLPQGHLEIIEGAGHLTTLEQPEKTNAALASWLEA